MADLPLPNVDPSAAANEGVLPDMSMLQIDESANNERISLADLHQVYIDRIAKFLDLKSVVRLQLTCKDLYQKGFNAQRLLTCSWIITFKGDDRAYVEYPGNFNLRWPDKQLNAMNCRFKAYLLLDTPDCKLTSKCIRIAAKILGDKGVVHEFCIDNFTRSFAVYPILLNRFLQDFKVYQLCYMPMPVDWLHMSGVKQLKSLIMGGFNYSLLYFLETEIHSCSISMYGASRPFTQSEDTHDILEKWTRNEKVIKSFHFAHPDGWDKEILLSGWTIARHDEEIPPKRPIVVQDTAESYRLIRADGACLWVNIREEVVRLTDHQSAVFV